jgi:predicted amidohydrolase
MHKEFRLALIQMKVMETKEASVDRAVLNVARVSEKGAEVVVLPEMFNCPYETHLFSDYAEEEGGYTWQKLSEAAERNKVYLIGGSIPEREEDRLYNTSYIFDPKGKCIGKHRKIHMLDIDIVNGQYFRESDALSAGETPTIVETEFGKIGVAICYDIRFPELSRYMISKGAGVLIFPAAFNMTTGPAHWELLLRSRAVDNQVYTVGCAPARDYDLGYISYGHSMVVNPWGDVIGELNEDEGYLVGQIDLEAEQTIRDQLPLLKHLKKEKYTL